MDNQFDYWLNESLETIISADALFEKNRYLESAFFCHLACEKMLKAIVAKHTKQIPPKIHSLIHLADLGDVFRIMTDSQKKFIRKLNVFQLEGRYPENRQKLYTTTPRQDFQTILQETRELILWLQQITK